MGQVVSNHFLQLLKASILRNGLPTGIVQESEEAVQRVQVMGVQTVLVGDGVQSGFRHV